MRYYSYNQCVTSAPILINPSHQGERVQPWHVWERPRHMSAHTLAKASASGDVWVKLGVISMPNCLRILKVVFWLYLHIGVGHLNYSKLTILSITCHHEVIRAIITQSSGLSFPSQSCLLWISMFHHLIRLRASFSMHWRMLLSERRY